MSATEIIEPTIELTPSELLRITKRKQHSAQARVLASLGVPHHRHPVDGHVLVDREALRRALAHATDSPGQGQPSASNASGIDWSKKA